MRNTCLFIAMVMLATAAEAEISTSPSRGTNSFPASLSNGLSRKRNWLWLPGIGWTVKSYYIPTKSSLTSAAKFDTKEIEEQKDNRSVKKFKACLHGHCYKKTSLPTMSTPITASTTRSTTFDAKSGTKELEEHKHKKIVEGSKCRVCWNHCHHYEDKVVCYKKCNHNSSNHLGPNHFPGH